jgi:uncharacterized protein YjbJ (UPF0337 family)
MEDQMSATDKAKNQAQETSGQVKKNVGKATGNEDLEHKGRAEETEGKLREAAEKAKDAFRN